MAAFYILLTMFVGAALAQTDIPNILEQNNITLPSELQDKLDTKNVEKLQNQSLSEFRLRCEKNGGPGAFDQAVNASNVLGACITGLVDTTQLQNEIEEAKPNGSVDEVFKKYCNKKPLFEKCVRNFTETTKVCFSADEQKHLKTVYNVSEQLAEFICFKEGDRIALFIAEGGQECFEEKKEELQSCFNQTGFAEDPANTFDVKALSNFTLSFDEKQCKQLSDLQVCVVEKLEKCPKPTSANIVESLFKFIRKATPCKQFAVEVPNTRTNNPENTKTSAASSLFVTSATVLMAATAAIFA